MFTRRVYSAILRVTQFIILLTFHEWGHAKSANILGDSTARDQGRMSLNPAVHIDPIGTLFLPLIGTFFGAGYFGWAKPVPVNPYNLKNPRRDIMFIAAAGPFMNIVLTFVIFVIIRILGEFFNFNPSESLVHYRIQKELGTSALISVFLAAFNMLPLFPLDGFSVVNGLLPDSLSRQFSTLAPYGMSILIAIIFLPGLIGIPNYVFVFLYEISLETWTIIGKIVGVR